MMKFKKIIESLILEATPDEIYNKYYKDINPIMFYYIVQHDPKSITKNNDIIRIGPYSKILLNIYKKYELRLEDLPKATEYLNIAYKHNIPLDIKKITSIADIYEMVKSKTISNDLPLNEILKHLNTDEYEIVINTKEWFMAIPKSEKAASYLGVNSEWCTTYGEYCLNPKYNDRYSLFKRYNDQGPLYIIINKNDEKEKYQFHIQSHQFMNAADKQINVPNILNKMPEIKKYFIPSLYTNKPNKDELINDLTNNDYFLTDNEYDTLTKKAIELFGDDYPMIPLILNEDGDTLENYIHGDNFKNLTINSDDIDIVVKKTNIEWERFYDLISYLNYDYGNPYQNIHEEVNNNEDYILQNLTELFKEYFQKEKNNIKYYLGKSVDSYQVFYNQYGPQCLTQLNDKFNEIVIDKSVSVYQEELKNKLTELQKYTYNDYGNTYIFNKKYFISYIITNNIKDIDDIDALFVDFQKFYKLDELDYENVNVSVPLIFPTYDDFKDEFHDYFNKIIDKIKDDLSICKDDIDFLNNLIDTKFKNNKFENDDIELSIIDNWESTFNCEKGVEILYKNKNTNKSYNGYVKVENLTNYLVTKPLSLNEILKLI